MPADDTDSRIIEQLQRRDGDGLAAAYDRYGRAAYSLLLRIVRDQAVAEDLTQELFLRLWNRSGLFDPQRGALSGWLLSIARNMGIDHVRSAQARFSSRLRPMEHVESIYLSSDPLMNESRIQNQEIIREAFRALSADERQLIELAYFEGLSQSEMAEKLQQPLGTVKSRVRAALARLRSAVSGTGNAGAKP
jgi:RNA polymerase sigma-70 factor, ECF subfamily